MESGEAMYYNWNRIALLSRNKITDDISKEIKLRMSFQNAFSCVPGDNGDKDIAAKVEKTLTPDVIKSVDLFMR